LTRTRDVVLYTVAWCPLWVGAGGYLPAPPRSTRTYISLRNVIALGDNRSLKTSPPLSVSPLSPSLPLLLLHPCPSFISEYSSSLPNSDDPGLAEWRWACAVLLLVLLLPTGKVRVPPMFSVTTRFSRFPPVPSRAHAEPCLLTCLYSCIFPLLCLWSTPSLSRWRDTVPCRDDDHTGSESIS
jgi:hypothetical protein